MPEVVEGTGADEWVPGAVLEATRALLRVSTAADARHIGEQLVRGLGGDLATSSTQSDSAIPADVSFGDGEPLLPLAPPGSAAGPSVCCANLHATRSSHCPGPQVKQ